MQFYFFKYINYIFLICVNMEWGLYFLDEGNARHILYE